MSPPRKLVPMKSKKVDFIPIPSDKMRQKLAKRKNIDLTKSGTSKSKVVPAKRRCVKLGPGRKSEGIGPSRCSKKVSSFHVVTRSMFRNYESWKERLRTRGEGRLAQIMDEVCPPHLYYRTGIVTRAFTRKLNFKPPQVTDFPPAKITLPSTVSIPNPYSMEANNRVALQKADGLQPPESIYRPVMTRSRKLFLRNKVLSCIQRNVKSLRDSADFSSSRSLSIIKEPTESSAKADEKMHSISETETGLLDEVNPESPSIRRELQINVACCTEFIKRDAAVQTYSDVGEDKTYDLDPESYWIKELEEVCPPFNRVSFVTQNSFCEKNKQTRKRLKSAGFKYIRQDAIKSNPKYHGAQTVSEIRDQFCDGIREMGENDCYSFDRLHQRDLGAEKFGRLLSKGFKSVFQQKSLETSFLNHESFHNDKKSKISSLEHSLIKQIGENGFQNLPRAKKLKSLAFERHNNRRLEKSFPRSLWSCRSRELQYEFKHNSQKNKSRLFRYSNPNSFQVEHSKIVSRRKALYPIEDTDSLPNAERFKSQISEVQISSETNNTSRSKIETPSHQQPQVEISEKTLNQTPYEAFLEIRHGLKPKSRSTINIHRYASRPVKMTTPMEEPVANLQCSKSSLSLAVALQTYKLLKKVVGCYSNMS